MSSHRGAPVARLALLALVGSLLLVPMPARAQSVPFDPLTLDIPGWLAPSGAIARAPPAAATVDFPASTPAAAGAPLTFAFVAPIRFAPAAFQVRLHLVESKPFVAQDADKQSLRLSLLVDGQPAPNATRSLAFAQPVAAGGAEDVAVDLVSPGLVVPKGASVALQVQALAPLLPEGALSVALGPSTAGFTGARLPSLDDLELQDAPLQQFLLANGSFSTSERDAAVYVVHVKHAGVDVESRRDPTQTVSKIFVVLRGEETSDEAASHQSPERDRRIAAAHAFFVDGQLARSYPGVGVVVALDWNKRNLTVPLVCAQNCPPGGFRQTLSFAAIAAPGAPGGSGSDASTLIPPPRDTSGIPTSQDAPPEKKLLAAPWAPLVIAGLLVSAFTRRR